jgi:hypothetical protein
MLDIGLAMSRLILDMRSNGRNTVDNKKKSERLAKQFLSVAEQQQDSMAPLQKTTEESGYAM